MAEVKRINKNLSAPFVIRVKIYQVYKGLCTQKKAPISRGSSFLCVLAPSREIIFKLKPHSYLYQEKGYFPFSII